VNHGYRIGVDENGLGAWLGPLLVTAVLARVGLAGRRLLRGRLPPEVARDLDDSKRLVSHKNIRLAEAWARILVAPHAGSPRELFAQLSWEGESRLRALCPEHVEPQCWTIDQEQFVAPDSLLERVRGHRDALACGGVHILSVKSSLLCTRRLNRGRDEGRSRFVMDLEAMERLVLGLREEAGSEVDAVCGKVGGIGNYTRFFGPLAGRLHTVLEEGPARSAYYFPALGQLQFVRDADAQDPLVMLASLVGKYLRELMMARISGYYASALEQGGPPSGYHEPRTARFVKATARLRRERRIPVACFERARDRLR
jgi:ribonuclease HII